MRNLACVLSATVVLTACGSSSDERRDAAPDGPVADVALKLDGPPSPDAPPATDVTRIPDAAADAPLALDADRTPDAPSTLDATGAFDTVAADARSPIDLPSSERPGTVDATKVDGLAVDAAPSATRVVLTVAPSTIIASAAEDTVVCGQLQDDAGNPVLTTVAQTAAIKVTLSASNSSVLVPTYDPGDERGKLVFEKINNPNWACTFFKATSTPGNAAISGTVAGLAVVPVNVTTVAKGGAAAALRLFALPARVPAAAVRSYAPIVQLVDNLGVPTVGAGSTSVTITSDNLAVAGNTSVVLLGGFGRTAVTLGLPGGVGVATLTAAAASLAVGTATLTVVP